MVEAVVLSVMDYGDVIYWHASAFIRKPLDAALRSITSDVYSTHHCILYEKVGWSPLSERRDRHLYLFSYKALIGKLPSYITSMLDWSSGTHQIRSAGFQCKSLRFVLSLDDLTSVSML